MSNSDQPKKPILNFKPLTSGLGFHPFSEGLPYASVDDSPSLPTRALPKRPDGLAGSPGPLLPEKLPQVARAASAAAGQPSPRVPQRPSAATAPSAPNNMNAAGATSAGAPSFARTAPTVSAPMAPKAPHVPQAPQPTPRPLQHQINHGKPVARPQESLNWMKPASTMAVSAESPAMEPSFGFGYAIKRVVAYFFDTAMNISIGVAAMAGVLWKLGLSVTLLGNSSLMGTSLLFLAAFSWSLIAAQEVVFGTTAGKRLFGLVLNGSTAAIFLRAILFLLSVGLGGIGILWAVFDPKRRCLHDVLAKLQPDEIALL